jgi:hypothetical protein
MNEDECFELLNALFPSGPAGEDVALALAPGGWARSALAEVFHPSSERVYEEVVALHTSLAKLRPRDGKAGISVEPTREKVLEHYEQTPSAPSAEIAELIGMCLWDVFSDNHEVLVPDGSVVDLGSFRAAAALIGRWVDQRTGSIHDPTSFCLGTALISGRANLKPVYQLIFRRMQSRGPFRQSASSRSARRTTRPSGASATSWDVCSRRRIPRQWKKPCMNRRPRPCAPIR